MYKLQLSASEIQIKIHIHSRDAHHFSHSSSAVS